MGRRRYYWDKFPREKLLDVRICDLNLAIEGTWLEECIGRLYQELEDRNIRLRPHCWLSDEWFSPDGVAGIALPFFLAHPRLIRLERFQMLEVEGGTRKECMKILRHEAGHCLHHGYRLSRRRFWQQLFGRSSKQYPDYYRPNPISKRYVQHLGYWYAQSHPDEDFAETFAVWLTKSSQWKRRYEGWPALKKLEYMDELMDDLAGRGPLVRSKARPDPVSSLKKTLRDYYDQKRARYIVTYPDIYDRDLKEIFSAEPRHRSRESAASFLRRNRGAIRSMVARWTGEYQFTLDQVLTEMIGRCTELKLRVVGSERKLRLDFAILLTVKTMHHLYANRHWLPL